MKPSEVARRLRFIASKLNGSHTPVRALVSADLRSVLASMSLEQDIMEAVKAAVSDPGSFEQPWGTEESQLLLFFNDDTGEIEMSFVPDINDRGALPVYSASPQEFDASVAASAASKYINNTHK